MVLALSINAFAQQSESAEKIVTTKWSVMMGSAAVADHYFTNQEYSGPTLGASVEFGSYYKKNENLSWKLDFSYIGVGPSPTNPAGTSSLKVYDAAIFFQVFLISGKAPCKRAGSISTSLSSSSRYFFLSVKALSLMDIKRIFFIFIDNNCSITDNFKVREK